MKKGLSRGLAPRYYGPFKIVGKNTNGCDYVIRDERKKTAGAKQIHVNNIKKYFHRGQLELDYPNRPASQETPRKVLPRLPNRAQRNGKNAETQVKEIMEGEEDESSATSRETSPVRSSETEESSKESEPEKVPKKVYFGDLRPTSQSQMNRPMQPLSTLPKNQG